MAASSDFQNGLLDARPLHGQVVLPDHILDDLGSEFVQTQPSLLPAPFLRDQGFQDTGGPVLLDPPVERGGIDVELLAPGFKLFTIDVCGSQERFDRLVPFLGGLELFGAVGLDVQALLVWDRDFADDLKPVQTKCPTSTSFGIDSGCGFKVMDRGDLVDGLIESHQRADSVFRLHPVGEKFGRCHFLVGVRHRWGPKVR